MLQPSHLVGNTSNDDDTKASRRGEEGRPSSPGEHQLPNDLSKSLLGLPMSSPRSLASALASPRLGDFLMSPRCLGLPGTAGGEENLDMDINFTPTTPASCAGLSSLFDLTPQHDSRAGEPFKAVPAAPGSAPGSGASSDAQLHNVLPLPNPLHNMQGPKAINEGCRCGDRTIEQGHMCQQHDGGLGLGMDAPLKQGDCWDPTADNVSVCSPRTSGDLNMPPHHGHHHHDHQRQQQQQQHPQQWGSAKKQKRGTGVPPLSPQHWPPHQQQQQQQQQQRGDSTTSSTSLQRGAIGTPNAALPSTHPLSSTPSCTNDDGDEEGEDVNELQLIGVPLGLHIPSSCAPPSQQAHTQHHQRLQHGQQGEGARTLLRQSTTNAPSKEANPEGYQAAATASGRKRSHPYPDEEHECPQQQLHGSCEFTPAPSQQQEGDRRTRSTRHARRIALFEEDNDGDEDWEPGKATQAARTRTPANGVSSSSRGDSERLQPKRDPDTDDLMKHEPTEEEDDEGAPSEPGRTCTCKKSQCLKLYCDCFSAGAYCGSNCQCIACLNRPAYKEQVVGKRQSIARRDPEAFSRKIQQTDMQTVRHKKGCNCRRSHCLKKYCECFQGGVKCGDHCKCVDCQNLDTPPPPKKPGGRKALAAGGRNSTFTSPTTVHKSGGSDANTPTASSSHQPHMLSSHQPHMLSSHQPHMLSPFLPVAMSAMVADGLGGGGEGWACAGLEAQSIQDMFQHFMGSSAQQQLFSADCQTPQAQTPLSQRDFLSASLAPFLQGGKPSELTHDPLQAGAGSGGSSQSHQGQPSWFPPGVAGEMVTAAMANWCSTPTTVSYPPPSKQGAAASSPGANKTEGHFVAEDPQHLKAGQATSQECGEKGAARGGVGEGMGVGALAGAEGDLAGGLAAAQELLGVLQSLKGCGSNELMPQQQQQQQQQQGGPQCVEGRSAAVGKDAAAAASTAGEWLRALGMGGATSAGAAAAGECGGGAGAGGGGVCGRDLEGALDSQAKGTVVAAAATAEAMCDVQKGEDAGGVGPQQAKHVEAAEAGGPQQAKREAGAGEGLADLGPGLASSNNCCGGFTGDGSNTSCSTLEAQLQLLSQLLSPLAGKEGEKGERDSGLKAGGVGAKHAGAPDAAAAAAAAAAVVVRSKHASSPQASDAVTLNYNASCEGGVAAAAAASAPGGDGVHATAESAATAGKRRNVGGERDTQGALENRAEAAAVLTHKKEHEGNGVGGGNGEVTPRQPRANCLSLNQVLPHTTSTATPAKKVMEEETAACVAGGQVHAKQEPGRSVGAGGAAGQGTQDVIALVRPVRTGLPRQRRGRGHSGAAAFDEGWGEPRGASAITEAGAGGGETQQQNQQQQQQQQQQQGSMPMSPGLAALVSAASAQLTQPHEQGTARALKEEPCREEDCTPPAARLPPPLSKLSPPPRRTSSPSHKRPAREFPTRASARAAAAGVVAPTSGLIPTSLFTSPPPLRATDPAGPKAASTSHNTASNTLPVAAPRIQNSHPSSAAALLAATATTSNAHTAHTINTRPRAHTTSATPPPPHATPPLPPTNTTFTNDDVQADSRSTPVPSGPSAPSAAPPPPKDFHEQRCAAMQYMMSRIAPLHLPHAPVRPNAPTPPPLPHPAHPDTHLTPPNAVSLAALAHLQQALPGGDAAAGGASSRSASGRSGAADAAKPLPPNPYALVRQKSAAAAGAYQQEPLYMNGRQLSIATASNAMHLPQKGDNHIGLIPHPLHLMPQPTSQHLQHLHLPERPLSCPPPGSSQALHHDPPAPALLTTTTDHATTYKYSHGGTTTTSAALSMVTNPLMPPPLPRPSTKISEAAKAKHHQEHPHHQLPSTNTLPSIRAADKPNSTIDNSCTNTNNTDRGKNNGNADGGGSRRAPLGGAAALLARAMGDHAIPPSAPGSIRARENACQEGAKGGPLAPGVDSSKETSAAGPRCGAGPGPCGVSLLQRQSVEEPHGLASSEACGGHGAGREENRGEEGHEAGETEEAVGLHMPASVAEYTRALLLRSPTCSMQSVHEVPPLSSGLTPTCHGTGLLGTPLSSRLSFVQQALLQQSSPLSSLASPSKAPYSALWSPFWSHDGGPLMGGEDLRSGLEGVCGPTGTSQGMATPASSAALPMPLFSPLSPHTHNLALDHPHLIHHHPQNVQHHYHHHHLNTAPFDPTMFFASPLKSAGGSLRDSDTLLPPHQQQQQLQH